MKAYLHGADGEEFELKVVNATRIGVFKCVPLTPELIQMLTTHYEPHYWWIRLAPSTPGSDNM